MRLFLKSDIIQTFLLLPSPPWEWPCPWLCPCPLSPSPPLAIMAWGIKCRKASPKRPPEAKLKMILRSHSFSLLLSSGMKNRIKKGAALISNVAKMAFLQMLSPASSSSSSSHTWWSFLRALSRSSGVNSFCAGPWEWPCPPWLWPPWLWSSWLWPWTVGPRWGGKSTMSSSSISSSTTALLACLEYLKEGFSSWEWPWSPWAWTTGGPKTRSLLVIRLTNFT